MPSPVVVGVVGGGLMGHGIAQVFAVAGHEARVYDPDPTIRASVRDRVARNLTDLGLDRKAVDRISVHATIAEAVSGTEAVIEAGPENLSVKQQIFAEIEASAPESAILASNTSVIPITQVMQQVRNVARALGTHWWNPPYLVPLVEVIRTPATSDDAVRRISELLRAVGKTPVTVRKDIPGFVGNRLQHALWREAIALVQNGVCDAETVDTVVKASFGRRLAVLGPLENADLVGTDLTLAIHDTVLPDLDRTAGALPYLRELVKAGKLGMKSGEGFRRWSADEHAVLRKRVLDHLKKAQDQDS